MYENIILDCWRRSPTGRFEGRFAVLHSLALERIVPEGQWIRVGTASVQADATRGAGIADNRGGSKSPVVIVVPGDLEKNNEFN
jgi:hypothetical protein